MRLTRMHGSQKVELKFFMTKSSTEKLCPGRKGSAIQLEASYFCGEAENSFGPFIVCTVFPHSAVVIVDPKNNTEFKVNGQRLKSFLTTELASWLKLC